MHLHYHHQPQGRRLLLVCVSCPERSWIRGRCCSRLSRLSPGAGVPRTEACGKDRTSAGPWPGGPGGTGASLGGIAARSRTPGARASRYSGQEGLIVLACPRTGVRRHSRRPESCGAASFQRDCGPGGRCSGKPGHQDDCKFRQYGHRGWRWSAWGGRRSFWLAGAWTSLMEILPPGAGR